MFSRINKYHHQQNNLSARACFFTYPSVLWFRSLSLGSWRSFLSAGSCEISSSARTHDNSTDKTNTEHVLTGLCCSRAGGSVWTSKPPSCTHLQRPEL